MEIALIKQPRVFTHQAAYRLAKRVLDLAICVLILPLAIPIMLISALAICLDSPGPVIFIQDRIGLGGKRFRIYKFRTMKLNSDNRECREFMKSYIRGEMRADDENQQVYKPIKGDEIFWVGRILRRTSLDELPQLINVLRGEMSIIGPRPNVTWEVDAYRPWHHERLEVLPGITGLAQVRGRSSIDFTSLVRYDIEYVERQSLMLDLKILWLTLLVAVRGKGAM